jgi:hypothetical protein
LGNKRAQRNKDGNEGKNRNCLKSNKEQKVEIQERKKERQLDTKKEIRH